MSETLARLPLLRLVTDVLLVLVSAAFLVEASAIAGPTYDSLGSASLPLAVAGLVAGLSLFDLARALLQSRGERREGSQVGLGERARWLARGQVAVFVLMAVLYVAAVQLRLTSFAISSAVFLVATFFLLEQPVRLRRFATVSAMLVLFAAAVHYVFTGYLFVDLP